MQRVHWFIFGVILTCVVAACDAGGALSTTTIVASSLTSDEGTVAPVPVSTAVVPDLPLVADGCGRFDGETLGRLTGLDVPLTLIQSDSTSNRLACNFVGTSDTLDAGVRVEVLPVDARAPGFWTTAGQLESPVEVAGVPVVGTGRGSLRTALPDVGGLVLTVTLRRASADAPTIRDRDHLDVRDAVAAYVIDRLV